MKWVKRVFWVVLITTIVSFLHYSLPSRDIVRIVGTDVKRMDVDAGWFWAGSDAGTVANATRDVRFIEAIWPEGGERVYRNEDTNWSWPPYFKFDSSNLNARAKSLVSDGESPQWVIVRHYGWRFEFMSMFPNALSMTPTDDPNQQLIPWFNIVLLGLLAGLFLWIYIKIRSFKELTVEPMLAEMDTRLDNRRSALGRWIGGLFGRR